MKKARIISSLLLTIFLQALLLASVHHHTVIVPDNFSENQTVVDVDHEGLHCLVCEFLTTLNLFASEQEPAFEPCFTETEFAQVVPDICFIHSDLKSTRAPPFVVI